MSSNAERVPKAGAQAKAEEAFLLEKIGKRAPSPTQAVKVCKILGLATRENIRKVRDFAKNKNASEAENKNPEEEMEIVWSDWHHGKRGEKLVARILQKALKDAPGLHYKVNRREAWFSVVECQGIEVSIRPIHGCFSHEKGYQHVAIHVSKKEYLKFAKRFAKAYEQKTGAGVMIYKDYD